MNTILSAPSLENLDGVACGAVADFDTCEPFRWIGTEIAVDDYAVFFTIGVFDDDVGTIPGGETIPPNYMLVEEEKRDMVLCDPCNRMMVCRGPS